MESNETKTFTETTEKDSGDAGLSRRKARAAVLQLLYSRMVRADQGGFTPEDDATLFDLIGTSREDGAIVRIKAQVKAIEGLSVKLDDIISKYLANWTIDRLAKIDRLILRIGTYELLFSPDDRADEPTSVAISNAMDQAKTYSTVESVTFINGVLGAVARFEQPIT